MTKTWDFPKPQELKSLPIHGWEGLLDAHSTETAKRKERGEAGAARFLVPATDFVEVLEALSSFKAKPRELSAYAGLGLIPPLVEKGGQKELYVYPDHLEPALMALVLRKVHQLPLRLIRNIVENLPPESRHVIVHGKLTTEQLLDLGKMLPRGFKVADIAMSKACETMLDDVLSSDKALLAATEPGNALQELEESLIFSRLEEIKAWVKAGRRRDFVQRESAEDFKELAQRQLWLKRLRTKALARRARQAGKSA